MKEKLAITLRLFFARDAFQLFFGGHFYEKFFAKKVAGENSVQIGPNFPAKSLSIYYINFY